jgi:hypothetical protein
MRNSRTCKWFNKALSFSNATKSLYTHTFSSSPAGN